MKAFRHCKGIGLAIAAVFLLTSVTGCLFAPRDPEEPRVGAQIDYLVQNRAENVWANMEIALENRDVGGWEEQLSPDFTCEDETPENDDPAVWSTWDKTKETAFATSFFTQVSAIEANLRLEDIEVGELAGEGWWRIVYEITVTEADGSQTIYSAQARIDFKLEGSFWYITRWADEIAEGSSLQTLGVLRTALASK